MDQIHPDDRERVKEAAAEARRTGIGKNLEYRIRCKNGTWLVLESTSSVIGNTSGVPEKLVIVNRNITARKQASEALRLSEVSFRSVIENAPYGIYRALAWASCCSSIRRFRKCWATNRRLSCCR